MAYQRVFEGLLANLRLTMTEVHHRMNWHSSTPGGAMIKEEVVYDDAVDFINLTEQVPMIVIESNQVSAETDAPMIIVANEEVSEQLICAEEVVETENDMTWYSNPPVVYEETVKTDVDIKPFQTDGRSVLPYLRDMEDISDIPLNDASYATYHPFPCDFCSRRFKKKANLMNHMVAHQTQRPHSCTICSSRFMRKCDLVNHQKIHSYVPNRENRDDINDDIKYSRSQNFVRKKSNKKLKGSTSPKKSLFKPKMENYVSKAEKMNYFKPTSYVDEDVKLLLEMTNRLHDSRKEEEMKQDVNFTSMPNIPVGTEDKPYVCNRCGKTFAREKALISHSQVHGEDSTYECPKCGARFFTVDLLREHTTKKHDTPYTGETSNSSDASDSEKGTYTGDDRFGTFNCTGCGINFHRLDLLKRHKKLHCKRDEYPSLYKCHTCFAMFSTNEKLITHIEVNASCQRHVCLLCGDHFSDPNILEKHIQNTHTAELTPNTCHLCGKLCKDKRALQKHCSIHSSDKRFSCKKIDCPKRFHSWARLRRHMLSHTTSKAVRCEECDEEFPDRRALINHRHSHYPDSNMRKFVCGECGKSFGSRSSQQIHNRIHTGERPYGCRYCWKAFADGGTLRKHERIHTGEKPYACVVCPRAFNQRVVLREHIRSHHSGSVSKPGYSTPVYLCQVCGVVTANSDELAVHLVKHSDDNTYKNRNPQPGIRTYKRRKKLNPVDYDEENEFEDEDFFEPKSEESDDSEKEIKPSPVRKSNRNNKRVDNYAKFTKTFEAAMKNINSLIDKPPVKKAKMINTKPKQAIKKVKKMAQKGPKKKPLGRNKLNVQVSPMTTRNRKETISENSESTNIDDRKTDSEMCLRTRNKQYVDSNKKSIRKPVAFQKKDESIDNDLQIESVKNDNGYVCGICNSMFPSKADLLFHVPIHI